MPLPAEFNAAEHLQEICRFYVNKLIREDFKDLDGSGGDWEPTITTSRASMRTGLTHVDSDSLLMTATRLLIYYLVFGEAKSLQADIFGIVTTERDAGRKYRPHLTLVFSQDRADVEEGANKVEGEISFRLMSELPTTITQAKVNALALEVKNAFALPSKFIWNKGRLLVAYTDWQAGYQFQLLVNNRQEAKDIINKVLGIQDDVPDWTKLTLPDEEPSAADYPANPGNQIILGETYKKPKQRPTVQVKFRYATLAIQGRKKPINLVDTTGYRRSAIEKTY